MPSWLVWSQRWRSTSHKGGKCHDELWSASSCWEPSSSFLASSRRFSVNSYSSSVFLLELTSVSVTAFISQEICGKNYPPVTKLCALWQLYLSSLVSSKGSCICQRSCQRAAELLSVCSVFNIPVVLDVAPSPDYVTAGGLCRIELGFWTGWEPDLINIKSKAKP